MHWNMLTENVSEKRSTVKLVTAAKFMKIYK